MQLPTDMKIVKVIEDLMAEYGIRAFGLELGKEYIFWSVTHHYRGKLKAILPGVFVLEDCFLIFRTGDLRTMREQMSEEEPLIKPFHLMHQVVVGFSEV